MPTRFKMMRDSPGWDAANGAAAGGFLVSWLAGLDWPQVAAFLAAIYTAFLILEKAWTVAVKWRGRRAKGEA